MEVIDRCRCVICSVPSRASVELVRETFSASRTLEKTLEMLWGRIADSEVDTKKIFKGMTGKRGNLFCFPCLAVLHAGMGLVSETIQLEERLFSLIGKITVDGTMISCKEANISQNHQTNNTCCYTDDISSRKSTQEYPAKLYRDTIPKRWIGDVDRTDDVTCGKKDEESHESVKELRKSTKKRMRGNSSPEVMMEVEDRCRCVICSIPSQASVDLVMETFSASRTLEKALEMLWGEFTEFEVATKQIFEKMTGKRGSLFCFPCLAVLHAGMGLVAEIMQLEERLRNLIGKITVDGAVITYKEENISRDQQTNNSSNKYEESKESAKKRFKTTTKKEIVKMRRNSSQEDSGNPTKAKPESIKNKPVKKVSARSTPLRSKLGPKTRRTRKCLKIYGVENCPSCDYKVDVRSPEQAAVSSESLSRSTRILLFAKSRYQLSTHFQDVHLGVSGMKKFTQMNSSGRKRYKCIECPFMGKGCNRVVEHYISIHVREPPKLVSTGRSSLSCPEEGCSFVSVAVKPGCTWTPNSDASMRNNLSSHVIRHHDRLSLSAGKCQAHFPLVVETADKSKEYQCTRCEYTKKLPEQCSNSRYGICYQIFLKHFFDVHLRELISNP